MTDTNLFVSNKTNLQMMGMHQLEMKKDGMRLELGVFFPENAPCEMVEDHKQHLAVEFTTVLDYAGQARSVKGTMLNLVPKHMKVG